MRECPAWFQAELTRIGGVNRYGDPVFKLVWSTTEQMTVGGRWAQTGFVGYKRAPLIHGEPCWALLVWEPAEVAGGSPEAWDRDFRDEETGLLQCGGYPKYGAYRVLQKFIHREIVQQARERHFMVGPHIRREIVSTQKLQSYRMEPCGLMLDVMLPMLMAWKRLSSAAKLAALKQQEQMRKDEYAKKAKDLREGTKLSRVMRGSQLVQKRAEFIERGMRQAMAAASNWGLGMAIAE
jgi:hypothetical protein